MGDCSEGNTEEGVYRFGLREERERTVSLLKKRNVTVVRGKTTIKKVTERKESHLTQAAWPDGRDVDTLIRHVHWRKATSE